MNRCLSCRNELEEPLMLCPHHHADSARWSQGNRIMCDFLHRGVIPRRLPAAQRDRGVRGRVADVAA